MANGNTTTKTLTPSAKNKPAVKLTANTVRLLFSGGARKASDNSAFHFAKLNVAKDYQNDGQTIKMFELSKGAKGLVDEINSQANGSIQSLDIFCHGGGSALFLIFGANKQTNIKEEELVNKNLNAPLYTGMTIPALGVWDKHASYDKIYSIDFNKFTYNAKIEIHGCSTAKPWIPGNDSICEDLSELLYEAGKKNAVVVGHTDKANPLINGDKTTIQQQDYRFGERVVFNNGEAILTTRHKGRISAAMINDALNKN